MLERQLMRYLFAEFVIPVCDFNVATEYREAYVRTRHTCNQILAQTVRYRLREILVITFLLFNKPSASTRQLG